MLLPSRLTLTTLLSFLAFFGPSTTLAHGGGLNQYGCHNQNSDMSYHCHQGVLAGQTFDNEAQALAALDGAGSEDNDGSNANSSEPEPYDRDDYLPYWADADGDCIDTRHEVLAIESLEPVVYSSDGCRVVSGRWYDPYTDMEFTDPGDVDIDHFVPLAEAHDSGAFDWSPEEKSAFANDISYPFTLIAVDDATNSAKGARDPAQWLPPNTAFHCDYVLIWSRIKQRYGLVMDAAEKAAIEAILETDISAALPTRLQGIRLGGGSSESVFAIGMKKANTCGYRTTAMVEESVTVSAEIIPIQDHVGKSADLLVLDRIGAVFYMLDTFGNFSPWNGRLNGLEAFMEDVQLGSYLEFQLYAGKLNQPGEHRFFIGYLLENGELHFTPAALKLTVF